MELTDIITMIIHIGFLTFLGINDIRKNQVSLISLIIYFSGAFAWSIAAYGFDPERIIIGAMPAVILFAIKKLTGLGIGAGDIAVFGIAGVTIGFEKSVTAMFIASVVCALYCLIRMLMKKADRKTRFAFIPFMGIGVTVAGLLG